MLTCKIRLFAFGDKISEIWHVHPLQMLYLRKSFVLTRMVDFNFNLTPSVWNKKGAEIVKLGSILQFCQPDEFDNLDS